MTFSGYRRRIMTIPGEGRVEAALEDDFHRMAVVVRHEGGVATAVTASAERFPWSVCPGATALLAERFSGQSFAALRKADNPLSHCTHLYELMMLAADHRDDAGPSRYDITVADRVEGRTLAEVRRDGRLILSWRLNGFVVETEGVAEGRDLRQLGQWRSELPEDQREAAGLIRRASVVSRGRLPELRAASGDPKQMAERLMGSCFTYSPERFGDAERPHGWSRDFSTRPDDLLRDRADPA